VSAVLEDSVLQCIAVCCSVLQCVVCSSVLQCVAVYSNRRQGSSDWINKLANLIIDNIALSMINSMTLLIEDRAVLTVIDNKTWLF